MDAEEREAAMWSVEPEVAADPILERFADWCTSFYVENLEALFQRSIHEFGRGATEGRLPRLAEWTAHRLGHRIGHRPLDQFLKAVGDRKELEWLREECRRHPAWARIFDFLTQEAPEYYFEEVLRYYGQPG